MSKTLIVLMVGMLAVGCGETEQPVNTDEDKTQKQTPAKELTAEEKKVVGTYELKEDGFTFRGVLLENGVAEGYQNGEKVEDTKWSIVDGEIHRVQYRGGVEVYSINKDGSITIVARIDEDGKREEAPEGKQMHLKKTK